MRLAPALCRHFSAWTAAAILLAACAVSRQPSAAPADLPESPEGAFSQLPTGRAGSGPVFFSTPTLEGADAGAENAPMDATPSPTGAEPPVGVSAPIATATLDLPPQPTLPLFPLAGAPATATPQPPQAPAPTQSPTEPPTQAPAVPPSATPRPVSVGAPPMPGPSPTWVLNYLPTPEPASGPSKLGIHVTANINPGALMDFVRIAQPAVMKGVEEVGYLCNVKAISPRTVTIGRFTGYEPFIGHGDPVQEADAFIDKLLSKYEQNKNCVDYWEGPNEPDLNQLTWYGQFEARRACRMQELGYRAAIGGFSTGTPEQWQFMDFVPAVEAAIPCGAIMTLHEYAGPTLYLWWTQGIPGGPYYTDRGPVMGRYRWLYHDILIPRGLVIPLAITEAGIHGGIGPGPLGGWLNFRQWWVDQGLTNDPDQFYVDQLAWYDNLTRQDSYVLGFTIFNVGGGQWQEWEVVSILPKLAQYAQGVR